MVKCEAVLDLKHLKLMPVRIHVELNDQFVGNVVHVRQWRRWRSGYRGEAGYHESNQRQEPKAPTQSCHVHSTDHSPTAHSGRRKRAASYRSS